MKRVPSSTESPVLYIVFTSSPVITSSALGLNRILSLCTDMHWVKTKLICLLLLYVTKLIPSSAHFLWSLVCSTKLVLLQNVDVHYFVFALSANLIIMGLGIFCRNQSFPFCAFYRCADFSQYFRIFPCFYEYIFKINGSYLGFFGRFVYSAYFEVAFYQS